MNNHSDKKLNSKRFYDQTADSYKALYGEEQSVKYCAALSVLRRRFPQNVLDVGCGPGSFLREVVCNAKLLVGVDISARMLRMAKSTTSKEFFHLICADADHLPIREGVFDTVYAFTLLQNMPEPTATIQEMERILRSMGTMIVSVPRSAFSRQSMFQILGESRLRCQEVEVSFELRDHLFLCQTSRLELGEMSRNDLMAGRNSITIKALGKCFGSA